METIIFNAFGVQLVLILKVRKERDSRFRILTYMYSVHILGGLCAVAGVVVFVGERSPIQDRDSRSFVSMSPLS